MQKVPAAQRPFVPNSVEPIDGPRVIGRVGDATVTTGDVDGLAASIGDVGLLQPVVVTPDNKLIAGERRLQACKALGWSDVPVCVIDIDAIVRGELAENTFRKDFTPSEMVAVAATVEKRERELAKQRMTLGKVATGSGRGKVRDRIAGPLGVSGRTLERAKAVVEAASAGTKKVRPPARADGQNGADQRSLPKTQDRKTVGIDSRRAAAAARQPDPIASSLPIRLGPMRFVPRTRPTAAYGLILQCRSSRYAKSMCCRSRTMIA